VFEDKELVDKANEAVEKAVVHHEEHTNTKREA